MKSNYDLNENIYKKIKKINLEKKIKEDSEFNFRLEEIHTLPRIDSI